MDEECREHRRVLNEHGECDECLRDDHLERRAEQKREEIMEGYV